MGQDELPDRSHKAIMQAKRGKREVRHTSYCRHHGGFCITGGGNAMSMHIRIAGWLASALLAAVPLGAAKADGVGPLTIAKEGHFYVGGRYYGEGKDKIWAGQAYVEYQIPLKRTHRWPIVMIEGCCAAGESYLGTPDGRDGWAQFFLKHGYAVYVMDQVGRGRSPWVESVYGKQQIKASEFVQSDFIGVEHYNKFPHAKQHTQFPGTGEFGDPNFDQVAAEMHPDWADSVKHETFNRDAIVALLDKIGPAILEPHSQSGVYAFAATEQRPKLVKAILAIEAASSPFHSFLEVGPPDWFKDGSTKPWGLTRATPLTYAPPVMDPEKDLSIYQQDKPDQPDLVRCWLQTEPAHQLVKFKGIPILNMSMEASFDAPFAHCTSKFLTQSGVANDFIRVGDLGIHGNGHFFMLEKNNLQIAQVVLKWLDKRVTPLAKRSPTVPKPAAGMAAAH
jgi:pimeloyl-ACP methyl ester carboxylesterase